jgi:hypothetical protein
VVIVLGRVVGRVGIHFEDDEGKHWGGSRKCAWWDMKVGGERWGCFVALRFKSRGLQVG